MTGNKHADNKKSTCRASHGELANDAQHCLRKALWFHFSLLWYFFIVLVRAPNYTNGGVIPNVISTFSIAYEIPSNYNVSHYIKYIIIHCGSSNVGCFLLPKRTSHERYPLEWAYASSLLTTTRYMLKLFHVTSI